MSLIGRFFSWHGGGGGFLQINFEAETRAREVELFSQIILIMYCCEVIVTVFNKYDKKKCLFF